MNLINKREEPEIQVFCQQEALQDISMDRTVNLLVAYGSQQSSTQSLCNLTTHLKLLRILFRIILFFIQEVWVRAQDSSFFRKVY